MNVHLKASFVIVASCICNILADFVYPDFNKTTGLVFNGAAKVTDCNEDTVFAGSEQKDESQSSVTIGYQGNTATLDVSSTVNTIANSSTNNISVHNAVFGHNAEFSVGVSTGCSSRLRLTSSHPSKAGSVWYDSRVPVLRGFETVFSWVITDPSVECTEHVDRTFSLKQHKSCAVKGGDGFAFVIHGDPNDSFALGGDGEHLGYGGIENSIAIEFDTWTNVDTQGSDDIFQDHISIHSAGPNAPNSSKKTAGLGFWRPYPIADGKVHKAKIQYLPFVETRYFELMTANENLIPYLKDNGEGRRLGTLAVFVDQGVIEDRPLFAIPVNLSVLLDLPRGLAFVGFTASSGRRWENHDVLNWEWCHSSCQ